MPVRRTRKKKGDGKAGGGLAARRQGWVELERADQKSPRLKMVANGNGVKNMAYHRPGSQNHNKGGRGRNG